MNRSTAPCLLSLIRVPLIQEIFHEVVRIIKLLIRSKFLLCIVIFGFLSFACGSSDREEIEVTLTITPEPVVTATIVAESTNDQEPLPQIRRTPVAEPSIFDTCLMDTKRRPELTWVVDKTRSLPDGFVPSDLVTLRDKLVPAGFEGRLLVAETTIHFEKLIEAALEAGFDLRTRSTYRSYQEQVWTFAYWVDQLGKEEAERVSAKPGHSEHQLGTTVDVTSASVGWILSEELGAVPEGIWLFENAYRFGFVESYPVDGEEITGYAYEPWHIRYIGVECATAWRASDLTVVEFLETLVDPLPHPDLPDSVGM